ncbi:B3 domain-containing protein [Thalictrum thalictroides]|uniref:B3 domain-containing protein n=1 Tax=Thalictrum thalictroides TaxID=46969 RepID=A0A7J6WZ93_THATH|nr:B3 domain-containing protein [Thalictrum thalictroides]
MRQKRMEENKKRMEELNLTKLALAVRNVSLKPSAQMKQGKSRSPRKPIIPDELRRSSRNSGKPSPVYKEVPAGIQEKPRRYYKTHRDLSNRVYADHESRVDAIERADEIESKLENGFPSFVKPMLQSHVTGGYWLGLPRSFCRKHLYSPKSKSDKQITLIDKDGDKWYTTFLADKDGLSGGWRGFAIAHELVDGDALVFELVEPTKFKVHIVKVNGKN